MLAKMDMEQQSRLALKKQLCFAIYSTSHAFTRAYRGVLDPLGLTYPQYLVMLILWEQDGIRVKQIGIQLYLDSGTLTPLLKRLEALGYIRRVRESSDERQVTISLTQAGHDMKTRAASIPAALDCIHLLDEPEMDAMIARMTRLRRNLQMAGADSLVSA